MISLLLEQRNRAQIWIPQFPREHPVAGLREVLCPILLIVATVWGARCYHHLQVRHRNSER